jgi:hypothetical protein
MNKYVRYVVIGSFLACQRRPDVYAAHAQSAVADPFRCSDPDGRWFYG